MKSVSWKLVVCVALVGSIVLCSSSAFAWGIFGGGGSKKGAPKTAKEFYNQERTRIAKLKIGTQIYGRTDFSMDWMKAGQELDEIMGVVYGIEICKGDRFSPKLLHFSKYDLAEPKFKFSKEKDYGFEFKDILMARVGVALKDSPKFVWCRPYRIEIQFQVPRLKTPEDKATVFSLAPIFTWEASPGATHYQLELAEDGDFTAKGKLMETELDQDSWLTQLDGPDRTRDTDDDIFLVSYPWGRPGMEKFEPILKEETMYKWRVTAYKKDKTGKKVKMRSKASDAITFRVPVQPKGETMSSSSQVTFGTGGKQYTYPTISPDGTQLAMTEMTPDGITLIKVLNADVKDGVVVFKKGLVEVTRSVAGSSDDGPAWTADSKYVIFHSNRNMRDKQDFNLWKKSPRARGYMELVSGNWFYFKGAASPDGKKIAYCVRPLGEEGKSRFKWYIWVMNSDGTSKTQLVNGWDPKWAPDSRRIAYISPNTFGKTEVWVTDLDGKETMCLTNGGDKFENSDPAWSPDTKYIAYVSTRSGNKDIWIMALEGSTNEVQLTNYLGTDQDPMWTPSGKQIIFSSTRNTNTYNIWSGAVPLELLKSQE